MGDAESHKLILFCRAEKNTSIVYVVVSDLKNINICKIYGL